MISALQEGPVLIKGLITKADMSRNSKGNPYLSLTLEDSSGQLDAKFWNLSEEQCAKFRPGQIVEAKGDLIYYRNAPQLRVHALKELPEEKVFDYVREAPMPNEEIRREIDNLLGQIDDPVLFAIVSRALEMNREDYFSYPAAVRNHHTYPGGLAYHSLSMARMIEPLVKQYPFLDRDLLIAGTLLHDIGKIEEYSQPVLPEYTPQGNLIGHISMMQGQLDRIAHELGVQDEEQVMLLKHMLLSHHGKHEFGSPVVPMTPEAEVLSALDGLDSRLEMMNQALSQVLPGTFGPRIFALENRMLYNRRFHNEKAVQEQVEQNENKEEKEEKA